MLGYFLSGPIPHQIILSHWYKKRRGRAMGIAYVGGALLGALGNLLNPWLVTFLPYTRALEISGFVLLLAWPVAIFVLRDRPEDVGQTTDGEPEDATAEAPIPLQPFGTLLQSVVVLAAARRQRGVDRIDRHRELPDEVRARRAGLRRSGGAQSDLEHRLVDRADRGDRGPPGRRPPRRSLAAAAADARHLRDRGRRDSDAVPRAAVAARLRLPVRRRVRLCHGRRLHADPADGRGSVRPAQPRPRDVGDSAGRHGHAVLVPQFHRAVACRLGRLRRGALGVVR